jgi:hypothetical protein
MNIKVSECLYNVIDGMFSEVDEHMEHSLRPLKPELIPPATVGVPGGPQSIDGILGGSQSNLGIPGGPSPGPTGGSLEDNVDRERSLSRIQERSYGVDLFDVAVLRGTDLFAGMYIYICIYLCMYIFICIYI